MPVGGGGHQLLQVLSICFFLESFFTYHRYCRGLYSKRNVVSGGLYGPNRRSLSPEVNDMLPYYMSRSDPYGPSPLGDFPVYGPMKRDSFVSRRGMPRFPPAT